MYRTRRGIEVVWLAVYFTMLYLEHITSNVGWFMNYGQERISKKV
jgi:hypothetical protein